jgi:hypothetical protein
MKLIAPMAMDARLPLAMAKLHHVCVAGVNRTASIMYEIDSIFKA